MKIKSQIIKGHSNGCFGILSDPYPHKQHPNQQNGLDEYIDVLNFDTGERCCKKLYLNTKGKHFKHTGYSPMYLHDFNVDYTFVPFQIISHQ